MGIHQITLTRETCHPLTPDILSVKDTLVKSVHFVMTYIICSLIKLLNNAYISYIASLSVKNDLIIMNY